MPQHDESNPQGKEQSDHAKATPQSPRPSSNPWFETPPVIKRLFDKFPLQSYAPNELPRRTTADRTRNTLYVFTTDKAAHRGAPSYNPSCLKWQAYLKFKTIDFVTVPSNNHASPTGSLPFLLTSGELPPTESPRPIPSNMLQRWALERSSSRGEPSGMRYTAYMSLLDDRIRRAWLYALYLIPANFESIAIFRYIYPTSGNPLVRATLSYQLRQAATTELLKHSPVIDVKSLFRDAEKAWEALSELLGDDDYFFAEEVPGLFDASVFAYTHLLLSESVQWKDRRVSNGLSKYNNLVEHSYRISERYFNGEHP